MEATLSFRGTAKDIFEISIQSGSGLLRVHVAKLFRFLLVNDLQKELHGLELAPIFFSFTFYENEAPSVEIRRVIQNNRLYFERSAYPKSELFQLRQFSSGRPNATGDIFLELNVGRLFQKSKKSIDFSEEYRVDPAYRSSAVVLQGVITS